MKRTTFPPGFLGAEDTYPHTEFPGPRWSLMSPRERFLYRYSFGLSERVMDNLWNGREGADDA